MRQLDKLDYIVMGFSLGMLFGLWLGYAIAMDKPARYTCTEYSPVSGKCVVYTDKLERSRYD